MAWLSLLLRFSEKPTIKVSSRLHSYLSLNCGTIYFQDLLAEFFPCSWSPYIFLPVSWRRFSATRSHRKLLATYAFQHHRLHQNQLDRQSEFVATQNLTELNIIEGRGLHFITSVTSYWLEASLRSRPHSKGRDAHM